MPTIRIHQSLSNSAFYEHICLENIKKLYKYSGKCDNQQQYKAIIETAMVSTTEEFTDNSLMLPGSSVTVKIPVQKNHSVYVLQYLMSKRKLLSFGSVMLN